MFDGAEPRPLLALIDVQTRFLPPSPADPRSKLIRQRIGALLVHARARGWWVAHMRLGRKASDMVPGLGPLPGESVFIRNGLLDFGSDPYRSFIERAEPDPIYVVGATAAFGCLGFAMETSWSGRRVIVVEDAVYAGQERISVGTADSDADCRVAAAHEISQTQAALRTARAYGLVEPLSRIVSLGF